jgi:hypothetical protein
LFVSGPLLLEVPAELRYSIGSLVFCLYRVRTASGRSALLLFPSIIFCLMPLEAAVVVNIGIVGVVGSVWSLHRARVVTVWSRLSRRGGGV